MPGVECIKPVLPGSLIFKTQRALLILTTHRAVLFDRTQNLAARSNSPWSTPVECQLICHFTIQCKCRAADRSV